MKPKLKSTPKKTGQKAVLVYILLLLLAVLTMSTVLYFFGPAVKEIEISYLEIGKKILVAICVIFVIFRYFNKKLA